MVWIGFNPNPATRDILYCIDPSSVLTMVPLSNLSQMCLRCLFFLNLTCQVVVPKRSRHVAYRSLFHSL